MVPALALLGAVFYFAILKPTERHGEENRLLATFGAGFVLQGVVEAIWGSDQRAARQGSGSFEVAGVTIPNDTVRNVIIAAIVLAALFAFLDRAQAGREIRATAQDHVGAEILGVDTRRAKLLATVISSGLTAAGGLMLFTSSYLYPQVGFALVLNAFAIVILAGLGSIGGTVVASLILGIATELVASYVDPSYSNLVPFVVIILVLLVRPTGLANRAVAA
jgi:branched-subunit amino acid ABC-type transport system permease component